MTKRHKNISDFYFAFSLLFLIILLGCARRISAPDQPGQVVIVTTAHFTDAEIATIRGSILEQVRALGWERTDTGYVQRVVPERSLVLFETQQIPKEGYDTVAVVNRQTDIVQVFYKNQELDSRFWDVRTVADDTGTVNVEIVWLRFGPRATEHHISDVHSNNKTKHQCLDFNGWLGDQQHHPHYLPQAWVNFLGSDCSLGSVKSSCWMDHTSWPSCDGMNSCSMSIGHSPIYHLHTSSTGPGN